MPCAAPHMVIERFDLWRNDAHAIWLESGGARVLSVAENRGDRPWTQRRQTELNEILSAWQHYQ